MENAGSEKADPSEHGGGRLSIDDRKVKDEKNTDIFKNGRLFLHQVTWKKKVGG